MRKLKILKDFEYFHRGTMRREYVKGTEVEVDDEEMIAVAVDEKWAKDLGAVLTAEELDTTIADLEAALADAKDADKPAIEQQLAEARDKRAALGD